MTECGKASLLEVFLIHLILILILILILMTRGQNLINERNIRPDSHSSRLINSTVLCAVPFVPMYCLCSLVMPFFFCTWPVLVPFYHTSSPFFLHAVR